MASVDVYAIFVVTFVNPYLITNMPNGLLVYRQTAIDAVKKLSQDVGIPTN